MKKVKFYSGDFQHNDAMRPKLYIRCYKASRHGMEFTIKSNTEYELINILVHKGKYDSYVIKNIASGVITSTKNIAEILN